MEFQSRKEAGATILTISGRLDAVTTPDYDLYAMNAEIEAFCEKQILPRATRHSLLLLVEELLQLHAPFLASMVLDITIAHSAKKDSLELTLESTGEAVNPLDSAQLPDEMGLAIIRNLCDSIEYSRVRDKNRLVAVMRRT